MSLLIGFRGHKIITKIYYTTKTSHSSATTTRNTKYTNDKTTEIMIKIPLIKKRYSKLDTTIID